MAHGGKRPGAGKPKGSTNKATQEVKDKLAKLGCDPIEGLARIAMEAVNDANSTNKPNERSQALQLAANCYKELAQYVAPKRKAVEHSGEVSAQVVSFKDPDSL